MLYIHIKVKASAKKELLTQKSEDHFEISVREPAEHNLANTRVREIVSEHFKTPKEKIHIVNGHHSSTKLLAIWD